VAVIAWDAAESAVYSRTFANDLSWGEDPATGSAALSTGVWLVAVGLVPPDGTAEFVITQGVALGRPSVLSCSVTAEGGRAVSASVHGAVVPVANGRIRVP
jgi:trans-2,3-dihydro-3-hydroxyanthranilate isomerase